MRYEIQCPETGRTLVETVNPFVVTSIRCEDCDNQHDYGECTILNDGMEIRRLK